VSYSDDKGPLPLPSMNRRKFLAGLTAGSVVVALGGVFLVGDDERTKRARELKRPDGRVRLPPGQRLLEQLRPMGGYAGDPNPATFRLKVHGEVDAPFELDFAGLLTLPQVEQTCDVHCVTGWSVIDSHWTGVRVAELAARAKVRPSARYVIFEAAHGYTANVPIGEALTPEVLVAHRYENAPLERPNGSPVRALVPDLYFWKSSKWLTGIRFQERDEPGYWEVRGYHNHGDPWIEERYG
jgi:DMSO/TMAO reductase YedYZ molybdopterin-dependent catalytic subunit